MPLLVITRMRKMRARFGCSCMHARCASRSHGGLSKPQPHSLPMGGTTSGGRLRRTRCAVQMRGLMLQVDSVQGAGAPLSTSGSERAGSRSCDAYLYREFTQVGSRVRYCIVVTSVKVKHTFHMVLKFKHLNEPLAGIGGWTTDSSCPVRSLSSRRACERT